VNHAALQRIGGVHLALPIRFARDLMASIPDRIQGRE
jgi:hypothetical protein